MQVVAVVDVGGSDFVLDRGEVGTDLFAKLGLDGGVARKKVDAPTRTGVLVNLVETIERSTYVNEVEVVSWPATKNVII